jgi:hypothetical protein
MCIFQLKNMNAYFSCKEEHCKQISMILAH